MFQFPPTRLFISIHVFGIPTHGISKVWIQITRAAFPPVFWKPSLQPSAPIQVHIVEGSSFAAASRSIHHTSLELIQLGETVFKLGS